MDVLAEYRNTEYKPDLRNPWLPWFGWMGHRPWWGHHRSHPGYWWWWQNPHQANSKYRPMGEYTYGNGLVSRTDWDPETQFHEKRWKGFKDREYYHRDLLGSTALLTDKFGMAWERYHYEGPTGLYNYDFRDYDAESGRLTTVDPIRDGSNWYTY